MSQEQVETQGVKWILNLISTSWCPYLLKETSVCGNFLLISHVFFKIQQEILLFKQNTSVSMSFGEDKDLDRLQQI